MKLVLVLVLMTIISSIESFKLCVPAQKQIPRLIDNAPIKISGRPNRRHKLNACLNIETLSGITHNVTPDFQFSFSSSFSYSPRLHTASNIRPN